MDTTVLPPKVGRMVTVVDCDRLRGRNGRRFLRDFPEYAGRTLVFHSGRGVEIDPLVYAWICKRTKIF